jgi:flagellar basal body rod protein FlgG
MGSFDQGMAGMVSLRAVNEWIGVINSNLGGSNRTAYKATRVSFGGGVAQVVRDPRQDSNGIQIPDSTLVIQHTRIDFSQGTIIQDGELTHLAISGDGFFAVSNGNDGTASYLTNGTGAAVGAPITLAQINGSHKDSIFFTRDGDFRWTVFGAGQTILTTAAGFTVLGYDSTAGQFRAISRIGTGATYAATVNTVSGADSCVSVFRFNNNQALKFSKYGSTIFDAAQAGNSAVATDVEIIQSGLESSNAALNDTLPELSLAQKMFSAVSKIINVHNSNLDVVVNLIR